MNVKIENWDLGASDIYKLRLWMDWNGNYELEENELVDTKLISPIGQQHKEHDCQFQITIPENAVKNEKLKFRLFITCVLPHSNSATFSLE